MLFQLIAHNLRQYLCATMQHGLQRLSCMSEIYAVWKMTPDCVLVQIYAALESAYAAIAERLTSSDGDYFFGNKPCSLDALLYGHLAFHQAAPTSCPEIQYHVRFTAFRCITISD